MRGEYRFFIKVTIAVSRKIQAKYRCQVVAVVRKLAAANFIPAQPRKIIDLRNLFIAVTIVIYKVKVWVR